MDDDIYRGPDSETDRMARAREVMARIPDYAYAIDPPPICDPKVIDVPHATSTPCGPAELYGMSIHQAVAMILELRRQLRDANGNIAALLEIIREGK